MHQTDVMAYMRIVLKRLWLILLLVGSTVATVVSASLLRPPIYRTTVRFQVTALPPSDVTLYQATRSTGAYNEEIATTRANFIEVLTSLEVAWETVDELNLPMSGSELVARTDVVEPADSGFVRLSVVAGQPALAADLANTLLSVAIRRYGELNARPLTLAREFIAEQIEQTQAELDEAQNELVAFQAQNSVGTLDGAVEAQTSLIRALALAHDEAISSGDEIGAASYQRLIDQRRLELQELIRLSGTYTTLETRVSQLHDSYSYLLDKMTEARLKENQARNLAFVQVLGQARVPNEPEPPVGVSILVLSIAVSTAIGVLLALGWEVVERRQNARAVARPVKQHA